MNKRIFRTELFGIVYSKTLFLSHKSFCLVSKQIFIMDAN